MDDIDWFKITIKLINGGMSRWDNLIDYGDNVNDAEEYRDALQSTIHRHFLILDQSNQQFVTNILLRQMQNMISSLDGFSEMDDDTDIIPIHCHLQQNRRTWRSGEEHDEFLENENSKERVNRGNRQEHLGQSTTHCFDDEARKKMRKSVYFDTNGYLKKTELKRKLQLAQCTINKQHAMIQELEEKILHIAEEIGNSCQVDVTSDLSDQQTQETTDNIQLKFDLLKKYERMIGELKLNEIKLSMDLEESKRENCNLEDSIEILYGIIEQLQETLLITSTKKQEKANTDILVLHDNSLKHIKTDLFEKQNLKIENILCSSLSDAYEKLKIYEKRTRVVILHTGTGDLDYLDVEEMCRYITDIHACVTNKKMKLIICNLILSEENRNHFMRIQQFNANIYSRFNGYDNVTICMSTDINDTNAHDDTETNSTKLNKSKLVTLRHHKRITISPYKIKGKENYNTD